MKIPLWQLPKAERREAAYRMRQLAERVLQYEQEMMNLAQQLQHLVHNFKAKQNELKVLLEKHCNEKSN